MTTILLLGGADYQVPAIQKANELGLRTVLCDYDPDNPGRPHADTFYEASTKDIDAIRTIASAEQIDGIAAYAADSAALTAAAVARDLHLPGYPVEAIETITNKDRLRAFMKNRGFAVPHAIGCDELAEFRQQQDAFRYPVIVKPAESSGSRGVNVITAPAEAEAAFYTAQALSRNGRVVFEEYIPVAKRQLCGDGFFSGGKIEFACLGTEHFNPKVANPNMPISISLPAEADGETEARVFKEFERLYQELGIDTGAFDFEARIDPEGTIYLIDIGPRNGGDYLNDVIDAATGVNLMEWTLRAAVGWPLPAPPVAHPPGCWAYFTLYSYTTGILASVDIAEEIRQRHIVAGHSLKKPGESVTPLRGGQDSLGTYIMTFSSLEEMHKMLDDSDTWFSLQLRDALQRTEKTHTKYRTITQKKTRN
ncbi:ATP-grasp domain-containing protein [Salisediminibacterium halotolerans]|uniref:Biotin carboxylase n=1 Tax=Salisediminibacterium halotolerans TaxID=517425 RepID=A0A1H9QKD6_9BACI|nr:ATP-grasp domain-containing protein [Salisediminibacterium haloalkalitolerans]SER60233.1 Biotin carboxylase [Salisediminibacterium haloalkalitolerans]